MKTENLLKVKTRNANTLKDGLSLLVENMEVIESTIGGNSCKAVVIETTTDVYVTTSSMFIECTELVNALISENSKPLEITISSLELKNGHNTWIFSF